MHEMLHHYIPYTAVIGGDDVIGFDITMLYWRILIVKFVFVFFFFNKAVSVTCLLKVHRCTSV